MRKIFDFIGKEILLGIVCQIFLDPLWTMLEPHAGWLFSLSLWVVLFVVGVPVWAQMPVVLGGGVMLTEWINQRREKRRANTVDVIAEQLAQRTEHSFREELAVVMKQAKDQLTATVLSDVSARVAENMAYVANMTPQERARLERARREDVRATIMRADPSGQLIKILEEREAQEQREAVTESEDPER